MKPPVIEFINVSKSYPDYSRTSGLKKTLFSLLKNDRQIFQKKDVLKNLNFKIFKGESLGFIGRNGVGKSTLLGLMARSLAPTSGSIHVVGKVAPLLELGGGFHPELSGLDNALLNAVVLGLHLDEARSKLDKIIEFSELKDDIHAPIRTYSQGMLMRLGFSVMTQIHPDILLVDEVLEVGDLHFQKKCHQAIEEIKRNGTTIVSVSHSNEILKRTTQRLIWIENKSIIMDGSTDEVLKEYCKIVK